jgi:hypothetical protein
MLENPNALKFCQFYKPKLTIITSDCFGGEFSPLCQKKKNLFWKWKIFSQILYFLKENCQKKFFFVGVGTKFATTTYNMKGAYYFIIFIFWISSNLVKYSYRWLLHEITLQNWKRCTHTQTHMDCHLWNYITKWKKHTLVTLSIFEDFI